MQTQIIFSKIDKIFKEHRSKNDEVMAVVSGILAQLLLSQTLQGHPLKPSALFKMIKENVKILLESKLH